MRWHSCGSAMLPAINNRANIWQQSVENMISQGVDTFIEIGPGRTLTGFMRKINRNVKAFNIEKLEDMEKVIKGVKESC